LDLLLGLDVGTTATKALLFDLEGNVVASASYVYDLIVPCPGWVEQEPEELWRGVVETSRAVLAQVGPADRIVALSQSSQAGTTIPADGQGQPLAKAISWMDERAVEQARRVEQRWGSEFIKKTTGWTLWEGLPLQHIAWLRDNQPDLFAAVRRFFFVNDFITHRLTGRLCMNPSDAGITQLMSVASGDWDERLLEIAGIERGQLSPIVPSDVAVGNLTQAAAEALGLAEDVLVVNGAHDQYCAGVGAGVVRPGSTMLSCGTAWVMLAVPETLETGLRSGMNVSRHAIKGRWGALRSLGGVGTSLEWLLDNVWGGAEAPERRQEILSAVNRGVARSPLGAGGLFFFPPVGGHASSVGAGRRGFVGLALSHTRDDLARALMEGVAFELRWALQEIRAAGVPVAEFKMIGGAAQSPVWPQIVADVTGVPVKLPAVEQAACRGAAILAGVGAGLLPDLETGFGIPEDSTLSLEPVPENRARYDDLFGTYRELFLLLNG
jgi:xylulokinase